MDESVTFWLENRKCAGMKTSVIGDQQLVLYRDRYYVVTGGAAQTRAGKPLRYSMSTLPSPWKLALKGEPPASVPASTETDLISIPRKPKNDRKTTEGPVMTEPQQKTVTELNQNTPAQTARPKRRSEPKSAAPSVVGANCPYCHARHEVPLEKGKSGKPFFVSCSRCSKEFAVRFVQVTMYQAQVAGFQ